MRSQMPMTVRCARVTFSEVILVASATPKRISVSRTSPACSSAE